MTVESAPFIDSLNSALPAGGDPKSEGDDHLRVIKAAVKATFPNLTGGAANPSRAEFNKLVGAGGFKALGFSAGWGVSSGNAGGSILVMAGLVLVSLGIFRTGGATPITNSTLATLDAAHRPALNSHFLPATYSVAASGLVYGVEVTIAPNGALFMRTNAALPANWATGDVLNISALMDLT